MKKDDWMLILSASMNVMWLGYLADYYWLGRERQIESMLKFLKSKYKADGRCPICKHGVILFDPNAMALTKVSHE